jgi:hypothetical protein
MRIAPGFDSADWLSLALNDDDSADWHRAIVIFDARIRGRFLDPVQQLIDSEAALNRYDRRFGFAVMAIDCLLVETLQAFVLGLSDTRDRSREMFVSFLAVQPSFAPPFTPKRAGTFFEDFRCGILHQAEIGRHSRVVSEGPLLEIEGPALVVNRNAFHHALTTEYIAYLQDLGNPAHERLRANFRSKMNFIARNVGAA